jgi:hypothetical protein
MNNPANKLAKILKNDDEQECAKSFQKFCSENADKMPLPGENKHFDQAMWAASQYMPLSSSDDAILKRVTAKMLGEEVETVDVLGSTVLKLRDLIGNTKEAAIGTWQDMLAAMQWQQMVPAGALRGVGTQLVSLGTFQRQIDNANIQVNLGWMVDKDQLRILVQAKDETENAISDVEMRVNEAERGVVFSRKTNQDGAVVAPNVQVGPGQYQIQVIFMDKVIETPFFRI